jgi:hypothetical protein
VGERSGYYDFWDVGSRATLRELLVNEGLAVHAAQAVAPGLDLADYFGYPRRQFTRLREIDAFLRRAVRQEIDKTGLGLRLRYLSDGMSPSARIVGGRVIPERSGYYVGWRMTERWSPSGASPMRCARRRRSSGGRRSGRGRAGA